MIEIYYRPDCPFSVRAIKLLKNKSLHFIEYDITGNQDLREKMIERSFGALTVPQIYINRKFIGGCSELYNLNQNSLL
jgi:glutaredoxin 3